MFDLKKDFDISLEAEHILLGQGIDPSKASPSLLESAKEVRDEIDGLIEPAALFGTLPVKDFQHERVTYEGGFFEGPLVGRSMAGASSLGLAICTIGPRIDEEVSRMMRDEPRKVLALEGGGVAAVNLVGLLTANIIVSTAHKQGLTNGIQTSPGQEGWPIEQQQTLFSVMPYQRINIRLTDSSLMLPRKSLSFVIPLGETMCADSVPCDFCSKKENCRWRKQKITI